MYESNIERLNFSEYLVFTVCLFFFLFVCFEREKECSVCRLELISFNIYFKLCSANLFIQLYLSQPQIGEYLMKFGRRMCQAFKKMLRST